MTGRARIEAPGRWRGGPGEALRDVRVRVGEATLVIAGPEGEALSHWSLPAVERLSAGPPARYGPGDRPDGGPDDGPDSRPDGGESVTVEDSAVIAAIERVRRERRRVRPVRWLRRAPTLALLAALAAGALWLPGGLRDYAVRAVPPEIRASLDRALTGRLEERAGPICADPAAVAALGRLAERLAPGVPGGLARVVVLPGGGPDEGGALLPGGTLVLPSTLLDAGGPDAAAGHALAAAMGPDPLAALLDQAGPREAGRLLTSARVSERALEGYALELLARPAPAPEAVPLLTRIEAAEVTAAPYAAAVGRPELAAADPHPGMPPILSDADWTAIRAGCG